MQLSRELAPATDPKIRGWPLTGRPIRAVAAGQRLRTGILLTSPSR